jgi:Tfp pilus assembly ATPase PilU
MNVSKQNFYKLINLNKNQLQNSWRFNDNDKEIRFKIQLSKKNKK